MKRESADLIHMAKNRSKTRNNRTAPTLAVIIAIIFIVAIILVSLVLLPPKRGGGPSLDSTFNSIYIKILSSSALAINYGAYLAATLAQQEQGYMNQSSLGDCDGKTPCIGMLFAFNRSETLCFWMKNTELPLAQSWIAPNGTITAIYYGAPYSTVATCHSGVAVLETSDNQAIAVGDKVLYNLTG